MSAKYDLERMLADIELQVKARLNTKLTSITTEKGDSISLAPVLDAAYFCQSLDTRVANYDPFIFYGVEDVNSVGIGPATAKDWSIWVLVCYADKGNDDKLTQRMFRYLRAMEEIFEDEWHIRGQVNSKIQSIPPTNFVGINSGEKYRATGVMLTIGIA
jgi:hypothetical protein